MSLFAQYVAERNGFSIIESDSGFATFRVIGETVYLEELYVTPDKRRSRLASEMADQVCDVGRRAGCKTLTGSVDPKAKGATAAMTAFLAYGMKMTGLHGPLILLEKEL